jgi:hypothetical protein
MKLNVKPNSDLFNAVAVHRQRCIPGTDLPGPAPHRRKPAWHSRFTAQVRPRRELMGKEGHVISCSTHCFICIWRPTNVLAIAQSGPINVLVIAQHCYAATTQSYCPSSCGCGDHAPAVLGSAKLARSLCLYAPYMDRCTSKRAMSVSHYQHMLVNLLWKGVLALYAVTITLPELGPLHSNSIEGRLSTQPTMPCISNGAGLSMLRGTAERGQ